MDPLTLGLIGTAVGAGAGALSGFGSYSANANKREFLKKRKAAVEEELNKLIGEQKGKEAAAGEKVSALEEQGLASLGEEPAYKAGTYTPRDLAAATQALMSPALEEQNRRAAEAIQGSAAARGQLLSGATLKAIADRTAANTAQAYADARSAALQQIGQDLAAFQAQEAAKQTESAQKQTAKGTDLNAILALYNSNLAEKRDAGTSATNLGTAKVQNISDYYTARAGMGNAGAGQYIAGGAISGALPFVSQLPKLV